MIRRTLDPERGSLTPLVAAAVWLAAVGAVGVGRVHSALWQSSRASIAADAAALAGVARGRQGAEALARANGATLLDYSETGIVVEVRVRFGSAEATAAAQPASIH